MRSFAAGIAVAVLLLLVGGQVALPPYLSGRVEDRLREGGGNADVSLSAIPSYALLAGRGSRFEANGSGLQFDPDSRRERPFNRLDGFDEVSIDIRDSRAGPLRIAEMTLARDGDDVPYELDLRASTKPRELAADLGSRAGGALGGLAGDLAARALPGEGFVAVPVGVHAVIASQDGRVSVTDADGSVAGLPSGPLTEIVLAAVLERL
ncbi:MAG TPA: hypothetical protein VFD31_10850 [Thermoleophilaceae bacterium]|nr:hypothetical protein [Thermoleophilaceae bacterium]